MPRVLGMRDGINGRNEHYRVYNRGIITRSQLVAEIDQGKFPNLMTITVNGQRYAKDKPDNSKKDNINQ